jgi:hypothetical protein
MTEQELKDAVREIYPYDSHCRNGEIIIRFPEITITNSRDRKHVIRNLFVKYTYDKGSNNVVNVRGPWGTRSTLTEREYRAGYSHSHLSGSTLPGNWSGFCLGSGNMASIMSHISSITAPTPELIFGMLLALPSYVAWESLEGGPYLKFEDIDQRGSRRGTDDNSVIYGPYLNQDSFPQSIDLFISDLVKTCNAFIKLKPSSFNLLLSLNSIQCFNTHALGAIINNGLMKINDSKILFDPQVATYHCQIQPESKEETKEEVAVKVIKTNVFDHTLFFVNPATGEEEEVAIPLERIKDSKTKASKQSHPKLEPIPISKTGERATSFSNLFIHNSTFTSKMERIVEELTTIQAQELISQIMS